MKTAGRAPRDRPAYRRRTFPPGCSSPCRCEACFVDVVRRLRSKDLLFAPGPRHCAPLAQVAPKAPTDADGTDISQRRQTGRRGSVLDLALTSASGQIKSFK